LVAVAAENYIFVWYGAAPTLKFLATLLTCSPHTIGKRSVRAPDHAA
jgi:hypothetical protein